MLTDFITIYENALSNEYCEKWIDYINTLREQGLVLNETTKTHERDHEVINFANKAKIKMLFTGVRHFNH